MVWVWARAALALPAVLACCCRVAATGTRSPPPIKKSIDVSSSDWFANAAPLQRPPAGHDAAAEVEYGAALFTHGKVTGSVDAFDTAMTWDGRVKGTLWQRGCAMYYTEQWVKGAAQFSFDVSENPNDTEESVWRWLCQARSRGVPYATANILNTSGETRPYMQKVYSMYKAAAGSGAAAAEQAVLALCNGASAQGSQGCFYSDMYYGLYAEAHGNATVAQGHLHRAGLSEYGPQSQDYMWWLTRVHNAVRGWPIRHPRNHSSTSERAALDPRMLGMWVDDYGNRHNITEHVWSQGHDNNYNIKQVDCNRSFLVAQNDATNVWDRLKWSRYDWVFSESIPAPYVFGFCMAAWNVTTQREAEMATGVDYRDLYKGCFGWPFTILKRVPRTRIS